MLDAVGARSWSGLAKGAMAVGLQCTDGIVTMTPGRDYEKQGGTSLPDQAITVPLEVPDLGQKLVEAFERCS
ncbi:hypothetical protein [Aquisalinus luteolus]|nr:hypothetical protein [Aquisalinus luteolus]GGI00319.1 hypothetical protein GCM10011355_28330 [Aquisalinus luteolus]